MIALNSYNFILLLAWVPIWDYFLGFFNQINDASFQILSDTLDSSELCSKLLNSYKKGCYFMHRAQWGPLPVSVLRLSHWAIGDLFVKMETKWSNIVKIMHSLQTTNHSKFYYPDKGQCFGFSSWCS